MHFTCYLLYDVEDQTGLVVHKVLLVRSHSSVHSYYPWLYRYQFHCFWLCNHRVKVAKRSSPKWDLAWECSSVVEPAFGIQLPALQQERERKGGLYYVVLIPHKRNLLIKSHTCRKIHQNDIIFVCWCEMFWKLEFHSCNVTYKVSLLFNCTCYH